MGIAVNAFLRITILYFLGEVILFPDDPRFAGKAIGPRNLVIVLTFSLVFPAVYLLHAKRGWNPRWLDARRWKHYPVWLDNFFLSLFWLDMAGNSFDLYDTYFYFDLIPHFHGAGVVAVVLAAVSRLTVLEGVGVSNVIHILLEAQEYYTDVFLGTHNVRGVFDVVNDLLVGVAATAVYALLHIYLMRRYAARHETQGRV